MVQGVSVHGSFESDEIVQPGRACGGGGCSPQGGFESKREQEGLGGKISLSRPHP